MKTTFKTWGHNYQKGRQHQIRLEAKTGVKWDFHSTGNGMHFSPIVTKVTIVAQDLADNLRLYVTYRETGFVALSEISGMELRDVLIAVKTLVANGEAVGGINRMGNFTTIRLKRG